MAFGESLNVNSPPDSERPEFGALRVTTLAEAIRERLDVDHDFTPDTPTSGLVDGATTGQHKQITMAELASRPSTVAADTGVIYAIEIGGKTGFEVMGEDEAYKVLLVRQTEGLCLSIDADDIANAAADIVDEKTITNDAGTLGLITGATETSPSAGDDVGVNKTHLDPLAGAFCDGATLDIDATVGLRIKPGALGQSAQVVGTTDITEATGAWADMADMEITLTTVGGNCLLLFSTSLVYDAHIRVQLDGATLHTVGCVLTEGRGNPLAVSLHWLEMALAAGEHTFKIQWERVSTTCQQNGSSYKRVFSVMEMPA